jgi:hypothetical protein
MVQHTNSNKILSYDVDIIGFYFFIITWQGLKYILYF